MIRDIKPRTILALWIFFLGTLLAITGCGGGSSSNNATYLMGGTVQGTSLNLAGTVSTYAGMLPGIDGVGTTATFNNAQGITSDGTYLYVTDTASNTIRKIEPVTGTVTTLAGLTGYAGYADGSGSGARFNFPTGITTDGVNLYVTDTGNCTIRKIVIATGIVTTLAGSHGHVGSVDGIGSSAEFHFPHGLTLLGAYLYVADTLNFSIRRIEISTGITTTLAGSPSNATITDGSFSSARFFRPIGITTTGNDIYLTDNTAIRKIDLINSMVTTVAGSSTTTGSSDGTATTARFYDPEGITSDGTYLYLSDTGNSTLRRFEISTGVVTTLAGLAGTQGNTNATGNMARFRNPVGITSIGTSLYIADTSNHLIRSLNIPTGLVTTLAGLSGNIDGSGTNARFLYQQGITTDGTNFYIADTVNHTIRKIAISTGQVTTLAGMAGVIGSNDGYGTNAQFYYPGGITTDGTNVYISDSGNHVIRKIEIATGRVTTIAGSVGISGNSDGTGAMALFSNPTGITTDGVNLYVSDNFNHTIRQIVLATGNVSTLAGTAGLLGSSDGAGNTARFWGPQGITTDGTFLYVADSRNHTVRKIDIATAVVTTLAGTAGSSGSSDGTGMSARFNTPVRITTDGTHLYVSDSLNHSIRTISIASGQVTTLAGSTTAIGGLDGTGSLATFNTPYGLTSDGRNLFVSDILNNNIRKIR